ncbi:hypothetical protein AVEN_151326-1 [Araneus ventricosus]|uniref:Uncharacterized protein n=1 Tax=Araneus ventricosus TaxID=182803 RepID=A0A4Y2EAA4_ARAVE|nr:hypothetical protein AVEN_151326-1 [Araneus ventricosus]
MRLFPPDEQRCRERIAQAARKCIDEGTEEGGKSVAVILPTYLTHGSRPTRKGVRPWQGLPGKESHPASGGTPCTQPQDSIYSFQENGTKHQLGVNAKIQ